MIRDFHKTKTRRSLGVGLLMVFMIMITLSPVFSDDWRDWVGHGVAVVGLGVAVAGTAVTSPVWGPALTVGGFCAAAVGIGIGILDTMDDSDEDETCSRCNVTYARGTDHYCIYDHIDEEHGGDESSEGSYGYSTGGYGYCPNGHYYSGVHSCYSSD